MSDAQKPKDAIIEILKGCGGYDMASAEDQELVAGMILHKLQSEMHRIEGEAYERGRQSMVGEWT